MPTGTPQIAFIYRNNIRERFANILSLLKNLEALTRSAYRPALLVPRRGWKREEAYRYLRDACQYYQACLDPTIVSLVPASLKFYGRSFGLLAALLSKQRNYRLVWSHYIFGAFMATRLGCPTVWEHHTGLTPKSRRLLAAMLRRDNFRGIISISEGHKAYLEQQGIPAEKIYVAHSGIDEALLHEPAPSSSEAASPYTLVYAGSFYPGRGVETVVMIAQQLTDCRFICIGGTPAQVDAYRTQYPKIDNLQFMAHVQRNQLFAYLREANGLLAPYTPQSQSVSGENIANFQSPLKLMEYMAFGKPIITARLGAIPEIIVNGENGLTVVEAQPEAYVRAIRRIKDDPALADRLGKNARQAAGAYTWDKRVAGILDFSLPQS